MSEWKARRFWTMAQAVERDEGHTVVLDGRPVRTPAKAELTLPSRALAEALAEEWAAQGEAIDPNSMPLTRFANSAIDKVARQHGAVAEMLAEYGGTDLICYRAAAPAELAGRQAAGWDPLLRWAEDELAAPLVPGEGVMHIAQPAESTRRLHAHVAAFDAFGLAGLHDLVTLSGSLVIGLAATRDLQPAEDLWDLSRIDETWQREQWGADDEAVAAELLKKQAFLDAKRFHDLSRPDS